MDRLKSIGFYTLSDERARCSSIEQPLARCELILTDKCNFNCPYCRGPKHERKSIMPMEQAEATVDSWISEGLKNIRFSGGEPTLYPGLPSLVARAKAGGVEHIAISTNGSANLHYYLDLVGAGVNDFSISLDANNENLAQRMAGGAKLWEKVVSNIRELSKLTYVTVGMVFTDDNYYNSVQAVLFAHELGVSDIRVLSAAQYNKALLDLCFLPHELLDAHPILKYRVENFMWGENVRGLQPEDSSKCWLVLDDIAVAGDSHFPCIIYLREGGDPIGSAHEDIKLIRQHREAWCASHDSWEDPICRGNCLDVCITYNNLANVVKEER